MPREPAGTVRSKPAVRFLADPGKHSNQVSAPTVTVSPVIGLCRPCGRGGLPVCCWRQGPVPIPPAPVGGSKLTSAEPSFSSYVSNVAHKPVMVTGTLAVSRTKVQDNAMPSLDRHLIGCALVLVRSSLAIQSRHGQTNRCDFQRGRLADAGTRTCRERSPTESRSARTSRAVTSRAFMLTDRGSAEEIAGRFGEPPAFCQGDDALQLRQPFPETPRPVTRFDHAGSTISLPRGRRQAATQGNRDIAAMSAGNHRFPPRQSGFRRTHSSTPVNAFLAPTIDPPDSTLAIICRRGARPRRRASPTCMVAGRMQ
jgi:hypothetical protein